MLMNKYACNIAHKCSTALLLKSTNGTLCLLDETFKEKEEAEEPESSIQEQARFNWAQVWMEEGELQGFTHPGIFFEPLSLLFCLALHLSSLYPLPMVPFRLCDLFFIFLALGPVPLTSGQLHAAGGRAPVTRDGVSGSQGPSKSRVCGGWIKG